MKYPNSTDLDDETRRELERLVAYEKRVRPHLISCYELRLSGALDVPPAWRKSLSAGLPQRKPVERNLFSGLSEDDDTLPEKQQPTPSDPDDDPDDNVSADELP